MPWFEHQDMLVYFAHVPKAGGTTVEMHISRRFGAIALLDRKWDRAWRNRGGSRAASLRTSPQHVAAFDVPRLLPRAPDWCFAVVRDPVRRAESEFRFHRKRGLHRKRLLRLGFSVWLETMLRATRIDPTVFDNHFRPQTEIVPDGAEVFHLEDGLEAVVAAIDRVTGTTAPELEIGHEQRGRPDPAAQASPADRLRIARFYSADYARFGYRLPQERPGLLDRARPVARMVAFVLAPVVVALYRRGRL